MNPQSIWSLFYPQSHFLESLILFPLGAVLLVLCLLPSAILLSLRRPWVAVSRDIIKELRKQHRSLQVGYDLCVKTPFNEEYLFRFLPFVVLAFSHSLNARFFFIPFSHSVFLGLMISAFFAVFHVQDNCSIRPRQSFPMLQFFLGFYLWAAMARGGLVCAILCHSAINAFALFLEFDETHRNYINRYIGLIVRPLALYARYRPPTKR